jgi:hypothetical protein
MNFSRYQSWGADDILNTHTKLWAVLGLSAAARSSGRVVEMFAFAEPLLQQAILLVSIRVSGIRRTFQDDMWDFRELALAGWPAPSL